MYHAADCVAVAIGCHSDCRLWPVVPPAAAATQTGGSAAGGGGGGQPQLPSLHLLRTLRSRLAAALQQVGQLRGRGPWQGRVLDQADWRRKLAKMDEFHAKITREVYILTRQVSRQFRWFGVGDGLVFLAGV